MIFHDAATAYVALYDTAVLWARILGAAAAVAACIVLWAAGPLIAPTARAVRRRVRPAWARGRARAGRLARRTRRDYGRAA